MKRDAVEHLSGCLSSFHPKTIVDLSTIEERDTSLYKSFDAPIIEGYNASNDGLADCVLCCHHSFENDGTDEILQQAKSLLSAHGLFFFYVIAKEASWHIESKLKKFGFFVMEKSVDGEEPKHHTFVLQHAKEAENTVVVCDNDICSKKTLACANESGDPLSKCCRSHLGEMLNFLAATFDKANITYWLDLGTLLGAARDGAIIPWDTNANIGIQRKDVPALKKLNKTITINNYFLDSQKDIYMLCYSRKNKLAVKIHPYNEAGGFLYNMQNYDKFSKDLILPTGQIKFNGKDFKCPANYERVLEIEYGYQWRTPCNRRGKITDIKN